MNWLTFYSTKTNFFTDIRRKGWSNISGVPSQVLVVGQISVYGSWVIHELFINILKNLLDLNIFLVMQITSPRRVLRH